MPWEVRPGWNRVMRSTIWKDTSLPRCSFPTLDQNSPPKNAAPWLLKVIHPTPGSREHRDWPEHSLLGHTLGDSTPTKMHNLLFKYYLGCTTKVKILILSQDNIYIFLLPENTSEHLSVLQGSVILNLKPFKDILWNVTLTLLHPASCQRKGRKLTQTTLQRIHFVELYTLFYVSKTFLGTVLGIKARGTLPLG